MEHSHFSASGSFLVFVDHCERGICSGRYISHCFGESGTFGSFDQLLLELEECMDAANTPQAFQKVRCFFPSVSSITSSGQYAETRRGKIASFSVHIRYRRNASWQGNLRWLDGSLTLPFRSVLELLRLLDSAVSGEDLQQLNLMEG